MKYARFAFRAGLIDTPLMSLSLKITLLVSLLIHVGAIMRWGGTSSSYHEQTRISQFNITLHAANHRASLQQHNKPERSSHTSSAPAVLPAPAAQTRAQSEPPQAQQASADDARQVRGQLSLGLLTETDADYLASLLRHLDRFKRYPYAAQRRGLEGKVVLQVNIDQQGLIQNLECLSGAAVFCQAARQTAYAALPLPVPPRAAGNIPIKYAMDYHLHK